MSTTSQSDIPISGRAGQVVTDSRGRIGITTADRAVRTETIGVIWEGGNYPVRMQLSELSPVKIQVAAA